MANVYTLNLPIDKIEPNNYNPNVMDDEEYEALKESVKSKTVDPILVSPKDIFYDDSSLDSQSYVIIDGENRWRAAKEVGLESISSTILAKKESDARELTYKRNRERGNIDPIKEARLFALEKEDGLNNSEIARKYGVSPAQITERFKLLNLDEDTVQLFQKPDETYKKKVLEKHEKDVEDFKQQIEELKESPEYSDDEVKWYEQTEKPEPPEEDELRPVGKLTASHLEILASIDDDKVRAELRDEILDQGLSVRQTEERAAYEKRELETKRKLAEIVERAKRSHCPECGGEANAYSSIDEDKLRCGDCYTWWDSSISQEEYDEMMKEKRDREKKEKAEQRSERRQEAISNPRYVRRHENVAEIQEKIRPWLTKLIKDNMTLITEVAIEGLISPTEFARIVLDNRNITITVRKSEKPINIRDAYMHTRSNYFGFFMEDKKYKRGGDKSRLDLSHEVSPLGRAKIHHLLDTLVKEPEARWPWADDEDLKGALADTPGEVEPEDTEIITQDTAERIIDAFEDSDADLIEVAIPGERNIDEMVEELNEAIVKREKEAGYDVVRFLAYKHMDKIYIWRIDWNEHQHWILHCAVNDVNWESHKDEMSAEEIAPLLIADERTTARSKLQARYNKLLKEEE
jgi:ParB/RepB/Spo0J family partition protein